MLRRLIVVLAIVSAVAVGFAQVPANPASKPDQTKRPPGSCNVSGRVVSAAEGAVDDVMFRLVRAGVIVGKVVDDTGEPMMGVNVSILHKPTRKSLRKQARAGERSN